MFRVPNTNVKPQNSSPQRPGKGQLSLTQGIRKTRVSELKPSVSGMEDSLNADAVCSILKRVVLEPLLLPGLRGQYGTVRSLTNYALVQLGTRSDSGSV